MKKYQNGGKSALGMKSVKAGFDKNPGVTRADIIVAAKKEAKYGKEVKKAQVGVKLRGAQYKRLGSLMTGSSLKQAYSTGGINISVELADFNFAQTMNSNLRTYTFDIDYTLRSSQIGGSVTVVTDPVFAGPIANNLPLPPTSGKMVITGANNTKITVEADADDTATITVNNDGPRNVYWTSELGW